MNNARPPLRIPAMVVLGACLSAVALLFALSCIVIDGLLTGAIAWTVAAVPIGLTAFCVALVATLIGKRRANARAPIPRPGCPSAVSFAEQIEQLHHQLHKGTLSPDEFQAALRKLRKG